MSEQNGKSEEAYRMDDLRRKVWAAMTKLQGHAKGQREVVKLQAVIAIVVNELMTVVVESKSTAGIASDPT